MGRLEEPIHDRSDAASDREQRARNDRAPAIRRRSAQTIAGHKAAFPGATSIAESNSAPSPSGCNARVLPGGASTISALLAVVLCLSWSWPATAGEKDVLVIPLAAMGENDWRPLTFRSIENETVYEISSDPDGHPAYRAISQCSASAMLLRLPSDFDLTRTPRLAWRWRIEKGLENHDEQVQEGDDFAARVYVLFRFDAQLASIWRRLRNEVGERMIGAEIPGEALQFVWGSRVSPGEMWISPIEKDARLLALESGSDGAASRPWREAIVDFGADAERAFDPAPRLQPYAVGLMTDSDDTCQSATAWFSDFRLLGPEPKATTKARPRADAESP